jgi:hypothetical protein
MIQSISFESSQLNYELVVDKAVAMDMSFLFG